MEQTNKRRWLAETKVFHENSGTEQSWLRDCTHEFDISATYECMYVKAHTRIYK